MADARLVAAASVAVTVTLIAIFSLRPIAPRIGLVDRPDERKHHKGRVPLIGGLCFFLGLVAGLSYLGILDRFVVSLLVASAVILLVGLLDDLYQLSVRLRLAVQTTAVLGVMAATGVYVDNVFQLADGSQIGLHLLGMPVTAFAVVGLMNAFNLMDGIDGLAGGLTMVSILAFLALATGSGWQALGVLVLLQVLLVALVPYLGVNLGWPDGRKIFMGDAGSTVLGFLLAWSAVYLSQRHVGTIAPVDVLWCVAIPVMDTLAVMGRRVLSGRSPFRPDRQHLHHLLLDAGFSSRATLAIILFAAGALAVFGYLLRDAPEPLSAVLFAGALVIYVTRLPAVVRWLRDVRQPMVATEAVAAAFAGQDMGMVLQAPILESIARETADPAAPDGQVRALCVVGEARDAVRIAPVANRLCHDARFDTRVCVADGGIETRQRILDLFDLAPDVDLSVGLDGGDAADIATAALGGMTQVLRELKPDVVLVHGDTPATLAATLAACYQQIPVARLESAPESDPAGADTAEGRINRRIASALASFHFINDASDGDGLIDAGVPRERIKVAGDTAVETLRAAIARIRDDETVLVSLDERFAYLRADSPLVLVTHREEIHGFAELGRALRKVARARPDIDIVYPLAMSPDAQRDTQRLGWRPPNVHLVEPLDYLAFAYLLQRARVVLTGSAEVQGEAALLGKPLLVLRDVGTPAGDAGIREGGPQRVDADEAAIAAGVTTLLDDRRAYESMLATMDAASRDAGTGAASLHIVDVLSAIPPRSSPLAA